MTSRQFVKDCRDFSLQFKFRKRCDRIQGVICLIFDDYMRKEKMLKFKKYIQGLLCIVLLLILACFGICYYFMQAWKPTIVDKLDKREQEILAAEFDLPKTVGKIQCASHNRDNLKVLVGPYNKYKEINELLVFKNQKIATGCRVDDYKTITGEVVPAMNLSTSLELSSEESYDVYVFQLSGKYYFEMRKDYLTYDKVLRNVFFKDEKYDN